MCYHRIAERVSAMYLFPSPLVRGCSFGREETFREDYFLWFLFPEQVVPVCICLTWAFPFQDYWLVTSNMGQMTYRDQSVLLFVCLGVFFCRKIWGGKKLRSCPGRIWSLLRWRYSKPTWMHTCVSCSKWSCLGREIISRGHFQPQLFCRSGKTGNKQVEAGRAERRESLDSTGK